jgi:hypothetical protein
MHTLSNAVEHARGCVATKIGLLDMVSSRLVICQDRPVVETLCKQSISQVELMQKPIASTSFQVNGSHLSSRSKSCEFKGEDSLVKSKEYDCIARALRAA